MPQSALKRSCRSSRQVTLATDGHAQPSRRRGFSLRVLSARSCSECAAHAAAREATTEAARDAARSAGHAAAAAYLHPLAKSTQVRHILGAAAHAARAAELAAGGDRSVGAAQIEHARQRATPALVAVLRRYPAAPSSGNHVTELMSALDTALRSL